LGPDFLSRRVRPAQFSPITAPAASYHIINRGEGETLMGKMTMQHEGSLSRSLCIVNSDFSGKMGEGGIIWLHPSNIEGIRACGRRSKRVFRIGDIS